MRKWGIVVSLVYALILVGVLLPAFWLLAGSDEIPYSRKYFDELASADGFWVWIPIAVLVAAQALLLFLSVNTGEKRLKPRASVVSTCVVTGFLLGALTFAGALSLDVAVSVGHGGKFFDELFNSSVKAAAFAGAAWLLWAVVFYLYARNASAITSRAVGWLLKGSVLELLIAVPCHVYVRRRNDCSAPIATGFGIVTGIAVMLLAFGPSVMVLYKKRLDGYRRERSVTM